MPGGDSLSGNRGGPRPRKSSPSRDAEASEYGADMSDTKSDETVEDTPGMHFAFWSWTVIVFGGLAVMIILPLAGR